MASADILTHKTIRAALKAAVATAKPSKKSDDGGLVFEARPTGVGWWRFRYRHDGKEGMLSLGTYPEVSLTAPRPFTKTLSGLCKLVALRDIEDQGWSLNPGRYVGVGVRTSSQTRLVDARDLKLPIRKGVRARLAPAASRK